MHLYSTEVHKMPVAIILQWIHWLCREYNYCVFVCTEWRRECTTALYISEYMSETILPDKVDIYTGTDIARIE